MHVIQNKDKNVIIKSTKCEKIFISWIHKVFKQIVSPFKSGCHLYSDRDQQTGNSCRYGNIRKKFILRFIGNSALRFMLKKVAGTNAELPQQGIFFPSLGIFINKKLEIEILRPPSIQLLKLI